MRILLALWLAAPALWAAYSNPIATSDGKTVYFQAQTGPVSQTWYAARETGAGAAVEALAKPLADVNGTGAVLAWSETLGRYCGFAGSSCWLAAWCNASFGIQAPGGQRGNSGSDTFIRLDRAGGLAWIEQRTCQPLFPQSSPLNGLYDAGTLTRIAGSGGAHLASQQYGRRMITDRGQALTLAGAQLQWLDAAGAHPIRNIFGAAEAVTDAAGGNVVYVDGEAGALHWIAGPDWLGAADLALGLQGRAPALTEDGSRLLYLAGDRSLRVYERGTGVVRVLAGAVLSFTVAGGAVFAVVADGALARIDLNTGNASVWVASRPDMQSMDAVDRGQYVRACDYICYGAVDSGAIADPGMVVVMHGNHMDETGWRVSIGGADTELYPLSGASAWFQIPSRLAVSDVLVEMAIYRPDHPLQYRRTIQIAQRAIACFGALHQDFGGIVTEGDPARVGEVVHIYLTGLQGTEVVADGTPNPIDRLVPVAGPPQLGNPAAVEPLFFGLAPGLIGIQQLDARILGSAGDLFPDTPAIHCAAPPADPR